MANDGRIFICEQHGDLRVVKDGKLIDAPVLSIPVEHNWERGLIGVTTPPNFPIDPYIYVVYVTDHPHTHHRVSRFRMDGDKAALDSEQILLKGDDQSKFGGNVPAGHQGGAIHFGIDGKLYVGVGDHNYDNTPQSQHVSQVLTNPFGKLLRLNPDGSNPADNPFYNGSATNWQGAIWTLGLRNPYTFAVQPQTGDILINDVGEGGWEEINLGQARANYGWAGSNAPVWEGFEDPPPVWSDYQDPQMAYDHSNSTPSPFGCSITGGTFYPADGPFCNAYAGMYFVADFCGNWIRVFDPANPGSVANPDTSSSFASILTASNPVDLKVDAGGDLYYLSRGGGGQAVLRDVSDPAVAPGIAAA